MPRCERWKDLNLLASSARQTAGQGKKTKEAECGRCLRAFEAKFLRLIPAPQLGRARVQIVCKGCLGG